MDQSDDNWTAVLHNTRKARQVWGRLGELLRREGAEQTLLAKFYRAVVQAVILFGADTWVLMETMSQRIEGEHVSFLRQVTHKQAAQRWYGSWRQVPVEEVLQVVGTKTLSTYVVRQQATVADWVATRPIFDMCA